jgi:hypothetical protein
MHMISHLYLSLNDARLLVTGYLKLPQIEGVICCLRKDGFAIVTTLNNVLRLLGQDVARESGHALS